VSTERLVFATMHRGCHQHLLHGGIRNGAAETPWMIWSLGLNGLFQTKPKMKPRGSWWPNKLVI